MQRYVLERIASDSVLFLPPSRSQYDEQLKPKTGAENREVVTGVVQFHGQLIDMLASISVPIRLVKICRSTWYEHAEKTTTKKVKK